MQRDGIGLTTASALVRSSVAVDVRKTRARERSRDMALLLIVAAAPWMLRTLLG